MKGCTVSTPRSGVECETGPRFDDRIPPDPHPAVGAALAVTARGVRSLAGTQDRGVYDDDEKEDDERTSRHQSWRWK